MRLTLNTLPQLAVLAKILCLLMVVMCGAVPAMVRSVSLYSTCSSGNITVIGRTVKASARDDDNAPFQKLTTQSDDFSRKLYIFAEKSQRFICFNKRWKPIALPKKQRDEMCQFYETYNGPYLRYRSAVDETKYLGFNKFGKPIKGQRARAECYNFMKYNPSFSINDHNDWMTGNTRVREVHRKHHNHHNNNSNDSQEQQDQQPQQPRNKPRAEKNRKSHEQKSLKQNLPRRQIAPLLTDTERLNQQLEIDHYPQHDMSRPLDLFEKNPDQFLRADPIAFDLDPQEFLLERQKKFLLERDTITYQRKKNPHREVSRHAGRKKNHLQDSASPEQSHRHRHTSRVKSGEPTRSRRHRVLLNATKY
ncbi:uncharacterized protein LOC103572717 isoform X2 [Microplitis demolitor]|uniref:uncharacterized protein LOC103572717 isoform X2 n=1 Tax=Microplitis demolitor TaxID=69319 RepID=UPI0004CDD2F2|nr:uncharacterized protein LOC103572717 isoform X2 [Microplitis demolitor]